GCRFQPARFQTPARRICARQIFLRRKLIFLRKHRKNFLERINRSRNFGGARVSRALIFFDLGSTESRPTKDDNLLPNKFRRKLHWKSLWNQIVSPEFAEINSGCE